MSTLKLGDFLTGPYLAHLRAYQIFKAVLMTPKPKKMPLISTILKVCWPPFLPFLRTPMLGCFLYSFFTIMYIFVYCCKWSLLLDL